MFPLQEAPVRRFPRGKVFIGLLIILLTVGTTLASRITLNSGGNITFGQGVLNIKACDDWIDISYITTETEDGVGEPPNREMAIRGINIDGFDSIACKNTNFKIKLFGPPPPQNEPLVPLDLYVQADPPGTISKQVWLSVNNSGVVSLLDTQSQDLGVFGDSAIFLIFDDVLGRYAIEFASPVQPSANVRSHTVQSGPNRA